MLILTCPGKAFDWNIHTDEHQIIQWSHNTDLTIRLFDDHTTSTLQSDYSVITQQVPYNYSMIITVQAADLTQVSELAKLPAETSLILYRYAIGTFGSASKST